MGSAQTRKGARPLDPDMLRLSIRADSKGSPSRAKQSQGCWGESPAGVWGGAHPSRPIPTFHIASFAFSGATAARNRRLSAPLSGAPRSKSTFRGLM